jgi:streptomycin 6-kinase
MGWPHQFKQSVLGGFPQGGAWLQSVPQLLRDFEDRWQITLGPPFELSFNYVAPAIDANGNSVVFKAGVPCPELTSEIQALRLYEASERFVCWTSTRRELLENHPMRFVLSC